MPEKPEVITVAKMLEKRIVGHTITKAYVYYDNVIVGDKEEFISKLKVKAGLSNDYWSSDMKIEIFTAYNYNEILKNIIKEISQKSSFTILDYYLITKVPINVLYDYSVKVNSEYQNKLKNLLLDVTNQQVMSQEEINSFIETNKNYTISQKRFQIEKYEKENLINYLKSLNIPLYNKIVLLALKRYLLGELQITEKQL